MDFSSPRLTWIMLLQIASTENSGDYQWTPIWQFLGWTSQPPTPRLTTVNILLWTEQRFVLPIIVTWSAYRFGFSSLAPLPAAARVGSQLPSCCVILLHITLASHKRMGLISKNQRNQLMPVQKAAFYYILHHLRATGPNREEHGRLAAVAHT